VRERCSSNKNRPLFKFYHFGCNKRKEFK
jgi:hypothetical protein